MMENTTNNKNGTQSYKLTPSGLEKLKFELEDLKGPQRERNLEALKEARAQGDLSENADYEAARDEQARIEARIKEVENIIKNAEIIREDASTGKVSLGNTVKLKIAGKAPVEYTIVGSLEADPFNNKISNESPVGKAVIGHKKDETVRYKTEAGKSIEVQILDVK